MGTERVRQGDFTHKIAVRSEDQLGELAGSFNQMTSELKGREQALQQAQSAPASPVEVRGVPQGVNEFQTMALTFPTDGCWKITATGAGHRLESPLKAPPAAGPVQTACPRVPLGCRPRRWAGAV